MVASTGTRKCIHLWRPLNNFVGVRIISLTVFSLQTRRQPILPWNWRLHHPNSNGSTMCSSTLMEKTSATNLFLISILFFLLLGSPLSFTTRIQCRQWISNNLFSISVGWQLLFSPKLILNLLGVFMSFNKSSNGTKHIADMFCQYITKSSHLMYVFRRVILEKT